MSDPNAPKIEGTAVDPGEIDAVQIAVRAVVNTFTYDGFNVGSRVTDEQIREVASAAVAAGNEYRAAKPI